MNKQKQKIRYKIGIMGSGSRSSVLSRETVEKIRKLVEEIVKNNCLLVTGACWAVALEAAKAAKNEPVLVFSPGADLKEHLEHFKYPPLPSNCIPIFSGMGREGRNVVMIRSCDALIFVSGRVGTLIEFSLAYQLGKVIGVLEGTGGITNRIKEIIKMCKKDTGAEIIYDTDPYRLVKKIINVLKQRENLASTA